MQNAPFYMQEAPCDSPHSRCAAFNQLNLWSVFAFYSPMRGITRPLQMGGREMMTLLFKGKPNSTSRFPARSAATRFSPTS